MESPTTIAAPAVAPQSDEFVQIVENKIQDKPTMHWFRRDAVHSITMHGNTGLIVRVGSDIIGLNFADSASQIKALTLLIYNPET